MPDSLEFWFQYVAEARAIYLTGKPVDSNPDPMLAPMVAWLKTIEMAMRKAAAEGRLHFSCRLLERPQRLAFRFMDASRHGFERTIRIDDRFRNRVGAPLTVSEIIDLKICIQSLIASQPRQLGTLPSDFTKFTPLDAVTSPPGKA